MTYSRFVLVLALSFAIPAATGCDLLDQSCPDGTWRPRADGECVPLPSSDGGGELDGGSADAGPTDAGASDAGEADAAAPVDAAADAAAPVDAAADAAAPDAAADAGADAG